MKTKKMRLIKEKDYLVKYKRIDISDLRCDVRPKIELPLNISVNQYMRLTK